VPSSRNFFEPTWDTIRIVEDYRVRTKLIRGGLSLLALGLVFAAGWLTRNAIANYSAKRGSELVVQRDFAPALADARTPASDAKVSEPSMVNLYYRVLSLVREEYVEPVDTEKLAHGSLEALLASLNDPRSQFLRPEQRAQFARALNGEIAGVGAVLTVTNRKTTLRVGDETAPLEQNLLQVVAVAPGSPAEKAGLKQGDFIEYVDDKWILSEDPFAEIAQLQRMHSPREQIRQARERAVKRLENSITISEAIQRLSQNPKDEKEAKPLQLTVKRGGQTLKLQVARATTKVRPLEYRMLQGKWGYLRPNLLNAAAAREFATALRTLRQGGAKGLVLDLRGVAIGQQEPALQILSQLAVKRQIAQVEYRNDKTYKKRPLNLPKAPQPVNLPIAVLVDRGTYNLAELTALATRQTARARIFGMPTFGDAAQTSLYQFKDGSGFTLTVGRYLGVDGTKFHQRGVQPDVRVAAEPRLRGQIGGDPALERALQWLTTQEKQS
ncbi:MAG: S41 family peptidase, partial [Fimbriimonadales bacterium]|nr:S41 family peptidase [Fimbriimonadales bacterium]